MTGTATGLTTCDSPFARGPSLCTICSLTMENELMGRCSRMVVESEPMKRLLVRTATVARTSAPVIVLGESGTGKEVLARALHANGPRKDQPFVAVNVAALPSELLESELFGHARGAFTGAVSARKGLMESADGGTLFLDEIGEMPMALQAKLLRALQDGEVRPVGGTKSFRVDVRIVCATHRDLTQLVSSGQFREDLYYRLKVFVLRVPPLRERVADIVPLARMFLSREKSKSRLGPAAVEQLEAHSWPGNVRELQNAMTHAAALANSGEILPEHLPEDLGDAPRFGGPRLVEKPNLVPLHVESRPLTSGATARLIPLAQVEKEHVESVLEACGGNQLEAARVLGIGRNTLWRKLKAWDASAPA